MKTRYLLGGLIALALGACSESAVRTEIEEEETVLGFQAGFVDHSTKAVYTTESLLNSTASMGVIGYKTTPSVTDFLVFDKQQVTNNGSGVWSYTPQKYWDKMATSYSFYAYVPHSISQYVSMAENKADAFKITGFTQNASVSSQTDILTDLTTRNSVKGTAIGQKVEFTFHHILANVNFRMAVSSELKSDTENPVRVVSVKLGNGSSAEGIVITGDYSVSNGTGVWTIPSSKSSSEFNATQNNGAVFDSNELCSVVDANGKTQSAPVPGLTELLMIPQTFPVKPTDGSEDKSYRLTVVYTIGTGENIQEYTKTIPLSDFLNGKDPATSWGTDCMYNYILVIGPTPIQFNAADVAGWKDGGTFVYTIG